MTLPYRFVGENAMRLVAALLLAATAALAQTAPPAISAVNPPAIQRGATVTLDVEGTNLRGASQLLFDAPGLQAKVVHVTELPPERAVSVDPTEGIPIPPPPRHQVRLEIRADSDTEVGLHRFRLQTPLGSTNPANLYVGPYHGEIAEVEPNDDPTEPQKIEWLPGTIVGSLSRPGDLDYYEFRARAGQQIVLESISAQIGSQITPVLTVLNSQGETVAASRLEPGRRDAVLGFTAPEPGKYLLKVDDYEQRGGRNFFYRIHAGEFPYVTSVFPLGVGKGGGEVEVTGYNLGGLKKVNVEAPARSYWGETLRWRLKTPKGAAMNELRLALGAYREIFEQEPNNSPASAQPVDVGVTVNGRIRGESGPGGDEDYFRFRARKGQKLAFEVEAQRLGSLLDSTIEVLDARGNPVPRATLRSLYETAITLNDPDSQRRGMRLLAWPNLEVSDLLKVGNEVVEIAILPFTPDDDVIFRNFRGQRTPVLDTTAEAHAVNSPVFKVQVHPPGATFPPNGLPVFTLPYQNDDGGPMFGKDSRLTFEAPAGGEYILRLRDVRGLQGDRYAYRLTIREAAPDFLLLADPANLNVPRGGRVPLSVSAVRLDGFDGEIRVELEGLPPGITATRGAIPAGQDSTVLLVSATASAASSEAFEGQVVPFRVVGRARANGSEIVRAADPEERLRYVAVTNRQPDLVVSAEPAEVGIEPGKTANVTVTIRRANGFESRVPVLVQNLPPGVTVKDFGLNGVLINDHETVRTFTLEASPRAQAAEQAVFAVGTVETSPTRTEHASTAIVLKVKPGASLAAQK